MTYVTRLLGLWGFRRGPSGTGLLRLPQILFLFLTLSLQFTAAQAQRTKRVESQLQPDLNLDTLRALESYKIYAEARNPGQILRSQRELVEPFLKVAQPPRELRSLINWLDEHADSISASRLAFATWPSSPKLPELLIVLEFPSAEESREFEPQLRKLLPKLFPVRDFAGAALGPQMGKERQVPYIIKRAGSVIVITPKPVAFRDLRPRGSMLLVEDQNFRLARDRFSSEALFLYINVASIMAERKVGATDQAGTGTGPNAGPATQSNPEPAVVLSGPDPNNAAVTAIPSPETGPMPTPSPGDTSAGPTVVTSDTSGPNPTVVVSNSISMAIFGGSPNWPSGIGAALALDDDTLVARLLFIDQTAGQDSLVPFFAKLDAGPPLALESPSIFPADTEIFAAGSLNLQQIYEAMSSAAKHQVYGSQTPQQVNDVKAPSPFDLLERSGISVKDNLLPLIGNEIAFSLPIATLGIGPHKPGPAPSSAADGRESAEGNQDSGVVFAISVKDRDALKALIPRVFESMGLKAASGMATTERRGDTELVSFAGLLSYAFIGNFLVGSSDPDAVRRVVDSYLNHETLSTNADFRNYTRWQPRQLLSQIYVSPSLMDVYGKAARGAATQSSEHFHDFLLKVSSLPQPITYALVDEAVGVLHELHIPKNFLLLMAAGVAGAAGDTVITRNEATARGEMRHLVEAERIYRANENVDRYGSLEELIQSGLISKETTHPVGYKLELISSGSGFQITAIPLEYGKTGKLSFFIDETSTMRAGDHAGGAATIADKPYLKKSIRN